MVNSPLAATGLPMYRTPLILSTMTRPTILPIATAGGTDTGSTVQGQTMEQVKETQRAAVGAARVEAVGGAYQANVNPILLLGIMVLAFLFFRR